MTHIRSIYGVYITSICITHCSCARRACVSACSARYYGGGCCVCHLRVCAWRAILRSTGSSISWLPADEVQQCTTVSVASIIDVMLYGMILVWQLLTFSPPAGRTAVLLCSSVCRAVPGLVVLCLFSCCVNFLLSMKVSCVCARCVLRYEGETAVCTCCTSTQNNYSYSSSTSNEILCCVGPSLPPRPVCPDQPNPG